MRTMRNPVEFLQKNPTEWYTLTSLEKLGLIPWARNARTIRKIIDADKRTGNILEARVTGSATKRRYLVRRDTLLEYLLTYGPILMGTVRKPKKHVRTSTSDRKANADRKNRA